MSAVHATNNHKIRRANDVQATKERAGKEQAAKKAYRDDFGGSSSRAQSSMSFTPLFRRVSLISRQDVLSTSTVSSLMNRKASCATAKTSKFYAKNWPVSFSFFEGTGIGQGQAEGPPYRQYVKFHTSRAHQDGTFALIPQRH
ncbi:MAG: hypothetical protein ALECFALPRED_008498 [Alectoria fallacina]|uniref:Uncharacterized protein n=1 Tax=Alectoria fallacina TaxID=1903189 RepID=A0A8H3J403_9LECA|nr:MAG: hypothetical protein ALECFALPRED_008498 [Alectoria fallacina]